MLQACALEFKASNKLLALIEFSSNSSYQSSIGAAPYEALYGRKCMTPLCWQDNGESFTIRPNLIQVTNEKSRVIQENIKTAQSCQKSCTDGRHRLLEFDVRDRIFLKVSPTKGITSFGMVGKLSPRYIGPYRITQQVKEITFQLELPPELPHDNPSHVIELDPV